MQQSVDTCNNLNQSIRHNADWKKSISDVYMIYCYVLSWFIWHLPIAKL